MKKKYKILLIVIIILIVLIVASIIVLNVFNNSSPTEPVKVVDSIDEFGYTLDDRDTELMKSTYNELKNVLTQDEINYEDYAEVLAKLFVIDFNSYFIKKHLEQELANFEGTGKILIKDS